MRRAMIVLALAALLAAGAYVTLDRTKLLSNAPNIRSYIDRAYLKYAFGETMHLLSLVAGVVALVACLGDQQPA